MFESKRVNPLGKCLMHCAKTSIFSNCVIFVRNISRTKMKRQLNATISKGRSMLTRKVIETTRGQFRTRLKHRKVNFKLRKLVECFVSDSDTQSRALPLTRKTKMQIPSWLSVTAQREAKLHLSPEPPGTRQNPPRNMSRIQP